MIKGIMGVSYYNEIDRYAAQWLRNLIDAGHLPPGDVDERSIVDVRPDDLKGYIQCHFFAGIGGWPYALALAGWPADRPVWTGSCPCQPLSVAGQQRGHADERHLWPAFHALIAQCKPPTVFGEQVASRDGREWFAGVRADLEAVGYACGAADLCAAGAGAPHIRQRLFWLADTSTSGRRALLGAERADGWSAIELDGHCDDSGLGIANSTGSQPRQSAAAPLGYGDTAIAASDVSGLGDAAISGRGQERAFTGGGCAGDRTQGSPERSWAGDWLDCLDGKARRVEPGVFPLADGVPARVGRLRGYGNAIVPQTAEVFIRAFLKC